ncbi:MAG: hypothetical protein B7Y45_05565 [Sphingomonas sp. 28-66-16]|nr:MAG: hypothetical protein B7Y45_05565 [Sphingomonas sp. 28-66-16]
MLKNIAIAIPLFAGGLYMTGALGGAHWSRDVARPQAEVMAALEDLDITQQPGSPATDPDAAGGVTPAFKVERSDNQMRWVVMSGDKVATTMIADFKPAGDGKTTHVTAHVERGNAPDDVVSPAFRSTGITLGLFSMALEGELSSLTKVAPGDPETCARLWREFERGNIAAGLDSRPSTLTSAVGQVATVTIRLQAFDSEVRRLGCERRRDYQEFRSVSDEMRSPDDLYSSSGNARQGTHFKPGEPQLDPSVPTRYRY